MTKFTPEFIAEQKKMAELHDKLRNRTGLHIFNHQVGVDSEDIDAILDEIERLQTEFDAMKAKHRWIPVSERLPEYHERVVFFGGGEMTTHIGYYVPELPQWTAEDGGYYHEKNAAVITHWMPLPEPPEGGEG